jgi:hypothetical protein
MRGFAAMKYRKDDNTSRFDTVKHRIWETTDRGTPNISVFDRKALRICRRELEGGMDFGNKLRSKAGALRFVSESCEVEFGARGIPKYDL